MDKESVILVDEHDQAIGEEEKQLAHEKNLRHRAFSVLIFREKGNRLEVLMQQRAHDKYHGGGLWTNTCCGHPRPGEATQAAAERRLKEEFGFTQKLNYAGQFYYQCSFDNGLSEHEIDHVFWARYDDADIQPNPDEIANYAWYEVKSLQTEMQNNPKAYTVWLSPALTIAINGIHKA